MKAQIIAIGDEILIGQVVNTNAAWLGEKLTDAGIRVETMLVISDTDEAIRLAIKEGFDRHDLMVVTGGLGPTHDDITKHVIADYLGVPLRFHEDIFEEIKRRFDARGIPIAASNRGQAMVPEGFEVLPNPIGTAPGLWYGHTTDGRNRTMVVLPGVPREMKRIMTENVLPRLRESDDVERIERRTILTTGIGESNLSELLGDLSPYLDDGIQLAFLPGLQGVRLRITAYPDRNNGMAERALELEHLITERAGSYVYGTNEATLEEITGSMLQERKLTIAAAESCTGGLVLSRLTDVPGASAYVLGGVVAYDNRIKVGVLGVSQHSIEAHGAVSREVVTEMAEGVRRQFDANIGVATSGILGPDGGTSEKPVGTVWIGIADETGANAVLLRLGSERSVNKERTVTASLNLVRLRLITSRPGQATPIA